MRRGIFRHRREKSFLDSVNSISQLPENQRHREYLKLFSKKGLRFSWATPQHQEEWYRNYTDEKFDPRINLIERLPAILVIEFDELEGGLNPSEALEQTEKFVKKQGWGYIRSSHKGKCDYLWLEFSQPISEEEAKRFLSWICPNSARVDINFSSPIKVFPVLFAPHRKYPHNEEPLYFVKGKKVLFSKLKIPRTIPRTQKQKTESGFVYETSAKQEAKPISPELLKILQSPTLFSEITVDEFDKKIVNELESRKVIFLCAAGGRLVKNCQVASYNLLVNDDAGTGKDYVTDATLSILPKETYIHKTRISPTVFTYWHNKQFEPEWTWNGKVFYPEDISETVLNSDVFKVMCSSGSSATIIIKQKAYEIEIDGKPVMITTTATATPNPELTRRFIILNLDGSEDQTKAIMKRHSYFKKLGIVPEYNSQYTEAMKYLAQVKVKIPYADLIDSYFPSKNVIMRTNYPRFLDFISASCAFHQFQRKKDTEGYLLAEGQDYDLARDCFLKVTSNRYMIPLTINQKKILTVFEESDNLKGSLTQLHRTMSFLSEKGLQTNLQTLVRYGILETTTEKDSWNRDIEVYLLSSSYNPKERFSLPTYEEICRNATASSEPTLPILPSIPSVPHLKKERGAVGKVGTGVRKDIQNAEFCIKCGNPKTLMHTGEWFCEECRS